MENLRPDQNLQDVLMDMRETGMDEFKDAVVVPTNYARLYSLIRSHSLRLFISGESRREEYNQDFQPRSLLGEAVQDTLNAKNVRSQSSHLVCCDQAETKLIDALDEENVQNPKFKSPIIITDDSEPVAVMKTYGEKTCYGLATREDKGIIEGAFASTSLSELLHKLPASTKAWQVDIDEIDPVHPLRLSTMLTPKVSRQALRHFGSVSQTLPYEHADMQAVVSALQQTAQPINGDGNIL